MGTTAPNDTSAFDAALTAGRVGRFNSLLRAIEDGFGIPLHRGVPLNHTL